MRCPACDTEMQLRSFGPVELDVCDPGCGGLWFDASELAKVDEPDKGLGAALDAALAHPAGPQRSAPIRCTRCDVVMREHRYENIRGVLVDECHGCGGFFLDAGELRAIRDALGARKEKHENVEAVLARDLAFQTNRVMSDAEKQRIEMLVLISKIFTRLYVGGVGL